MIAYSPAPVTAAFSNSSSPTSCGESFWAAIPDPITTAARNAEPSSSARTRRGSGGGPFKSSAAPVSGSLKIDNHHFNWYSYIDECRSETHPEEQAAGRRTLLRAGGVSRRRARTGRPHGGGR